MARAPARIDFSGGVVDVAPFVCANRGRIVNAAINRYVKIRATQRGDGRVQILGTPSLHDNQYGVHKIFGSHASASTIRRLIGALELQTGLDIEFYSSIPQGVGLGSSGALTVAVVAAVKYLAGQPPKREDIAAAAANLERKIGIAGGRQDQYASALGGIHLLEFEGSECKTTDVALSTERLDELSRRLLILHRTGRRHSGKLIRDIIAEYSAGNKRVKNALLNISSIATEMESALRRYDIYQLSKLAWETLENQKLLHPQMVSDKVEELFFATSSCGLLGGKVLGGGGRNACILAICEEGRAGDVFEVAKEFGWHGLKFDFDKTGLEVYRSESRNVYTAS